MIASVRIYDDEKDALIQQLAEDCRDLRRVAKEALAEKDAAQALVQSMTRTMLAVAEKNAVQMAAMQEQLNDVALFASLVPSLRKQIEEVGRVADRTAQFCTALGERVDGLAAREPL